jgi:hypothetical protein
MRVHLLAIAVLLAACGGATAPPAAATSTCVNGQAAHKAYLVVTHLDGHSVQKCVGFASDQENGEDLMKQSGIEFQSQTFSFGKAVCQIDNEPASFSDCFPKDQPFWALFTETAGGSWTGAQVGYTAINLKAGEAMGWRYTSPTASPAPTPAPPKA